MNEFFLSEILEIKNGKDHQALEVGDIPVFGSGGLMRYVNKSIYSAESILLPRKGSLSNIQYVNKPFWTVDTLYYTIVNRKKANPFYLYHYLGRLDLSNLNSGTGVPSMTFGAYYNIKVFLPSISEQNKIASVLSALDEKIENNNKIKAELEVIAKTLYDYWFLQFDYPDENGKPYKNSGGKMVYNTILKREIPENWDVNILGNYISFNRGISYTAKSIDDNDGIPMVNLKSFNLDGTYREDGLKYYKGNFNSQKLLHKNDLLIAITDVTREAKIIGKAVFVPDLGERILFSCDVAQVVPIETKLNKGYLKFLFNSEYYHNYIKYFASGTLVLHLDLNGINWFTDIIPPIEIQNKFGEFIENVECKIQFNRKQNQELTSLRDWLLPMLMNGQVTVGDAEYKVNEAMDMVAEDTSNSYKTTS